MSLHGVRKSWEQFAKSDPLWSILSAESKRGGKWSPEEFFATGRAEIAQLLADLELRGIAVRRDDAIDFGCGVGRLTQALSDHFTRATGIDISTTMVESARSYDVAGRCRFIVNTSTDISILPDCSADLIYTNIVLQHNEPEDIERYLRAFVRLLKPGGALVFQLPAWKRSLLKRFARRFAPRFLLEWWRWLRWRGGPQMLMNGLPPDRVVSIVEAAGARLVDRVGDESAGADWIGFRYFFVRAG